MTLSMAQIGESVNIQRITGKDEVRRFLFNLGFVEGATVKIVSELNGNMVINIKDTRIAISKVMGNRIIVA